MGTISGVIGTEEFIASLKEDGEAFDKGLCTPDDPANWAEQIRQASDIMKDGTQDPTKTCDGISIGLGFDAKLIQLGGVAPAQPQPPDPCGPAP